MSMEFVDDIMGEKGVVSEEERWALKNHALFQEFIDKWPLSVYFQIR